MARSPHRKPVRDCPKPPAKPWRGANPNGPAWPLDGFGKREDPIVKAVGEALEELEALGLGGYADDRSLIDFCAGLIFDEITANVNVSEIPEKLWRVYVDMVCGEYLFRKLKSGALDELFETDDGDGGPDPSRVTSVSVGEVSVGLSESEDPKAALELLIDELRHSRDKRYLFDVFRVSLI